MVQSIQDCKDTDTRGRFLTVRCVCSGTLSTQSSFACGSQVVVPLRDASKLPWGCLDRAFQGNMLSSSVDGIVHEMGSEIVRKFSRPPSQLWSQFVNRRQADAGMGVLILFAGLRRPNSVKNWLIRLSAHDKVAVNIEDFDILNGPEHDLVDDLVARKVLRMIDEQAFHAIFMSPPCSTFSCLRSRSLRGVTGKDRYGWQHLTKDEMEAVRCETACSSFKHGVRSEHRSLVCRGWWSCLLDIQVNLTCCSWTSGRFLCRL